MGYYSTGVIFEALSVLTMSTDAGAGNLGQQDESTHALVKQEDAQS